MIEQSKKLKQSQIWEYIYFIIFLFAEFQHKGFLLPAILPENIIITPKQTLFFNPNFFPFGDHIIQDNSFKDSINQFEQIVQDLNLISESGSAGSKSPKIDDFLSYLESVSNL